jgi:transposase
VGPAWATVHQARKRQGVTGFLRWQAYQAATPDALPYRGCCPADRAWTHQLALVRRQHPRAGAKRFGDDAGQGLPVSNRQSGEGHEGASFVAVLGASHDPYADAPWTPRLPDWIGSHGRPLAVLGGVPAIVGPATLQAAVPRAHRDAPELHRPSAALAQPSGCAVLPARAAKPRAKAKGAVGVHVVARGLWARLRHDTCFSLAEVQPARHPLWPALHTRPCKKLPGARQPLVAPLDRPALRPWPAQPSA